MAFQTPELWMLALGIQGDIPPNALQPPECVDFRPDKPGPVANPLAAANGDATLTCFGASGARSPACQVQAAGGTAGWNAGSGRPASAPAPLNQRAQLTGRT